MRVAALPALALAPVDAYLLVLLAAAAAGGRARPAPPAGSGPPLRFAVLVPARDEETSLPATLASLGALEASGAAPETIVVADHCRDATAQVAHAAGATVWERDGDDGGGKGGALAWALARLLEERPSVDAVLILDADCTVDPGLLAAVEARLHAGAAAVQVHYEAANPDASRTAALRYASLALVNLVRPLGKARLGLSAGLFGTGMAFSRALLVRRPWVARSLVEDQEHHLRLLAGGERVAFAPETRVRSAMPTTLARSASQQLRWDAGRLALTRRWTPRLVASGLRRRDAVQLHGAFETLVPPQSLLLAAHAAATLAAPRRVRRLALAGLASQAVFVVGGLAVARAPAPVWRALAFAPALAVWKLALLSRLWRGRGPAQWVRTEREPSGASEPPAGAGRVGRPRTRPAIRCS
jgi:hypothetical protein